MQTFIYVAHIVAYTDCSKLLCSAQGLMSSMASNYDMRMLVLGQVVAAAACVLATAGLYCAGTSGMQSLIFVVITLAYGIMMFASSYVEEEQHFWYWMTTAWMASLVLKSRTRYSPPHFYLRLTPLMAFYFASAS